MLYKKLGKPILFRMDPEKAHHLTIDGLSAVVSFPGGKQLLKSMYGVPYSPILAQQLWGLQFANPIGLAAGLDKNAKAVKGFSQLGFGFMEVGTITPKPQPGNELPRLFRLPEDKALINRMGFNNVGTDVMATNLMKTGKRDIPVAINIGKNKTTPNEQAEEDYRTCIRELYTYGDFFVVNISSPNTPDLRNLQHGNDLKRLLDAVTTEMQLQEKKNGQTGKPVLVKIAPDLTDEELELTVHTIKDSGISGIIATNTTLSRQGLVHPNREQAGGLSGKPLTQRTTEVIRRVYQLTEGKLPIIGSGGIFTAQDAYDKIRAGASLVEVYTGFIYEGPGMLTSLNKGLQDLLRRDGYTHISQAIGADQH
ncbi:MULTISPECIES: quinone-dependent dihydroorotate dehydrogenase [unclassified Paenibacillus]|uniref:quinone-dependent dihydroorotate dehydrogenase n=1 Tax=unclassified Paenibacillus TaxID=185978 RepID=UPI00070AD50D|nr:MULTISPECIES: quinone-dependent dihydroorotate dehydrogenase [unclassified Paenibacillus]KQX47014.1 dihydroorotate dehydrogenase (quinone) [Paenibacillus sp. Root444D2]KRE48289.1 dihydroorotate dehydrogenase (quinone) [Paenibacillus sp. Soil724D2]